MTERPAPGALTFGAAGPGDVDAVVALVESAYRGEASRAGWTTEADLLDGRRTDAAQVAAVVADPGAVVLLARDEDGIAGCCELRRAAPPSTAGYFGMFAVRPDRQGRGTGRALLERADAEAVARHGADALEMTVIAQRTDLLAWYARLGFAPTGERRPFPHGDERFGLPRRADLEFVVLRRATRR